MKRIHSLCFLIFIMLFACKSDPASVTTGSKKDLAGMWLLEEASRNGLETNTLQGLFYNFSDTSIISNITGDTLTASYVIKEGKIIHMMQDTILYDIMNVNDTVLEINSVIRSMPFQFKFKKQKDTIQ